MARAGRVTHHALRLRLDSSALQNNWRWLQRTAGVPTAAAVKADGYGLGAIGVTRLLAEAGCRDFFVSTWAEVEALGPMPQEAELVVLHGVGPEDLPAALAGLARPMLNTPDQIARWKEAAFPLARLHDSHWPNPDVVDVHAVFPLLAHFPTPVPRF